jgi:ribosomal protein S6
MVWISRWYGLAFEGVEAFAKAFVCWLTVGQKELVPVFHQLAKRITSSGGVVQSIEDQGVATLPYRMRAHVKWHTSGR